MPDNQSECYTHFQTRYGRVLQVRRLYIACYIMLESTQQEMAVRVMRCQIFWLFGAIIVYTQVHLSNILTTDNLYYAYQHNTTDMSGFLRTQVYLDNLLNTDNRSHVYQHDITDMPSFLRTPSSLIRVHVAWVSRHLGKYGESPIPSKNFHAIESWRSAFSDVVVWDNQMIRAVFPEHVSTLERIHVGAWISDIIRYLVILRFGGVYVDADISAINNDLRDLLAQTQGNFSVCQTPWLEFPRRRQDECVSVINAVLAAPPGSKAVSCALAASLRNTHNELQKIWPKYTTEISGPPVWTRCALKYNVNILDSWTFLPCAFSMQGCTRTEVYTNMSGVYGMHAWDKSWWSQ